MKPAVKVAHDEQQASSSEAAKVDKTYVTGVWILPPGDCNPDHYRYRIDTDGNPYKLSLKVWQNVLFQFEQVLPPQPQPHQTRR